MPKLTFEIQERKLQERDPEAFTVVSLSGFIDAANHRFLERALESGFHQNTRFVVLDFAGVHYINSTGISTIIRYFGLYKERNGLLVLSGVPKNVGLSLHLLGVTSLIPFHKDVPGALAEFQRCLRGDSGVPATARSIPGRAGETGKKVLVPVQRSKSPLRDSCVLLLIPRATRFSRILHLRFQKLNGKFNVFHDSTTALKAIERVKPDLVVVDDRMDPTGEFVTKLKTHPERSLISVVKIYGKDTDLDGQLKFKIWENDYLVDPFETLELFSLTEAELLRVPKDRKVFLQQIRFEFRTTSENVEKATRLSDHIVRRCLALEEDRTAMYAAVKEGIDNAVLHGNRWDSVKTVDVNFLVGKNKVTVIVEDQGNGFDFEYYLSRLDDQETFEKARRRIMTQGRRGGLGILLMHRCTDRIEYSGTGNILRLEKNRT